MVIPVSNCDYVITSNGYYLQINARVHFDIYRIYSYL